MLTPVGRHTVQPQMHSGIVSGQHRVRLTLTVGTVRNALPPQTATMSRASRPLPNLSFLSSSRASSSTESTIQTPSANGRGLPSLPSSAAASSKQQMISRPTNEVTYETVRHSLPVAQNQESDADDDQMLDGVILPALNNVSFAR